MWHPFDLMPDELAVPPDLRSACPGKNCTVSFDEKALTYFRDKSSKTDQWPPSMDSFPGVRIRRRTGKKSVDLEITHQWHLDYLRELRGAMSCVPDAWIAPRSWSFLRTFEPRFSGAAPFDPVEIRGSWNSGELTQAIVANKQKQTQTVPAASLISTYALLSGFPVQGESLPAGAVVLGEDLVSSSSAAVLHRCPEGLRKHPLAQGLSGVVIDARGNLPTEFWVNEHGLVIYAFNGVSKLFVLKKIEEES